MRPDQRFCCQRRRHQHLCQRHCVRLIVSASLCQRHCFSIIVSASLCQRHCVSIIVSALSSQCPCLSVLVSASSSCRRLSVVISASSSQCRRLSIIVSAWLFQYRHLSVIVSAPLSSAPLCWRTVAKMSMNSMRRVAHCPLICLLRIARFAHALRCAQSFGFCLWNECVAFIQFQPTVHRPNVLAQGFIQISDLKP